MNNDVKPRQPSMVEVLGPVEDLESYVKADWWRHIFNANYLRTDGDVVEDPKITKAEVSAFIDALKLPHQASILDLCCGQGRHTAEFYKRGYHNIFGVDRSHYLIYRARKLNKKLGVGIQFREGDARKLRLKNDTFDAVMILGNSFGYFETVKDDHQVVQEVKRVLKPGGKLLIDVTDGAFMREHFEPRSWEWIDKNYFVCRESSLSKNNDQLISREVITHVSKGVIADQFYAERLYTFQEIEEMLLESGFQDVAQFRQIKSTSKRNQDLGMMAQRVIVTASVEKSWTPVKSAPAKSETVIVLMGDPTKKDTVKPNAVFDQDDFATIQLLKDALGKHKQYQYVYLDHHDTLIQDLAKYRSKCSFAFNLCDEGFNNEATKELHVGALLEMMGISYTGGTPQCLAYCYDKSLIRGIASEMDIPVSSAFVVKPEDVSFIDFPLSFPVIVKPNAGDSSFGITRNSVCYNVQDLENAISMVRDQFGYNHPILIETFLTGKDLSVGIIGNPTLSYTVLPIIEEDYSSLPPELPRICGYEAKWQPDSPYAKIQSKPAELSEETERFLVASCLKLFERLGCRDYARFDWRVDSEGTPRLLEVNPNPGWCWDGHLAKMAHFQDISYSKMLQMILDACKERLEFNKIHTRVSAENQMVLSND